MVDPPLGSRIADRYELLARLGAGGMGVVYRATDIRLGRQVALKLVRSGLVFDGNAQARLLREARAAAALNDPGVVQVYDVGQADDGTVYVVMELVAGRSLADRIAQGPLGIPETIRITREIARVLGTAHRAGIVHRDIKPENVMLRTDGRVALLDFGLALMSQGSTDGANRLTADGDVLGTVAYMSPEQARGMLVDGRADQFSLAVLAYELLCGRRPWTGPSVQAIFAALLTEAPPVPTSIAPGLPAGVDAVLLRALDKDPLHRFESVEQFADVLGAIDGLPSAGAPSHRENERNGPLTTGEVASARTELAPRSRTLAVAPARKFPRGVAVACVLILAVAGAWTQRWSRHRRSAQRATTAAGAIHTIACPPFEVENGQQTSRWLGAAAGSSACRRIAWWLGGREDAAIAPAALLDLPRRVGADFPEDPFADDSARARTITAARRRADAWLDGRIRRTEDGVQVTVTLRDPRDRMLATARGEAAGVAIAVRSAVESLTAARVVPELRIDPIVARWRNLRNAREGREIEDLAIDVSSVGTSESWCVRWLAVRGSAGTNWIDWARGCAAFSHLPLFLHGPAPVDARDLPRFAAEAAHVDPATSEAVALADRLEASLRDERESEAIAAIAVPAAALVRDRDLGRAQQLLFLAVEARPHSAAIWDDLADTVVGIASFAPTARAYAAWMPDEPYAWLVLASNTTGASTDRQIEIAQRAVTVAPTLPYAVRALARRLAAGNRIEELRSLAATLATGDAVRRGLSQALRVQADAAQGHFAGAYARAQQALTELLRETPFGVIDDGDVELARMALELALVLGDRRTFADRFYRDVLAREPSRIVLSSGFIVPASACLLVSPALARPCADRLVALRAAGLIQSRAPNEVAFLEGAIQSARGNRAGAVAAWRTVVRNSRVQNFIAPILDEAGEFELAEMADSQTVARGEFHGASLALARAALRAESRGDRIGARALAQRLVDAWSDADTAVPAVAQMTALLTRTRASVSTATPGP